MASATASRHSQGASMSRTTRSTVPASTAPGSASTRSPTTTRQAGWSRPKKARALPAGDVGEVLAALERDQLAVVADGPQQRHAQGPGPDPGLDDPGAGEDVGHRHDLGRVLGVDHGRPARHRHHVVGEQRTQREVLGAGRVGHDRPVGRADEVVVGEPAGVGVELAPGSSVMVWSRPFGSVSWTRSPTSNGPRRACPRWRAPTPTPRPRPPPRPRAVSLRSRFRTAAPVRSRVPAGAYP